MLKGGPSGPPLLCLKLSRCLHTVSVRHIHCAFQRVSHPWLKVIPFTVNQLPVCDRIAVTVKIVLMMVDDLPAGPITLRCTKSIPPAIAIMVPADLIGRSLYQGPVRPAISINPAVTQTILLGTNCAAVWDHLGPVACVSLYRPHLSKGNLCDCLLYTSSI